MSKLLVFLLVAAVNAVRVDDTSCAADSDCTALGATCVDSLCACSAANSYEVNGICVIFVKVEDCTLPACQSNVMCLPTTEQCTRVCSGSGWGSNDCPEELAIKKGDCPAVDCQCEETGQDNKDLLDIECETKNMIITVPAICRSGSFKGFDWDKSFFDSKTTTIVPQDDICLGVGTGTGTDRVYTIPLTRNPNDASSCNMVWTSDSTSNTYIVYLNTLLQEKIKMGRIEVSCTVPKTNTQTSVKGSYSGVTNIAGGNDNYDTDLAIDLNIYVWDQDQETWSAPKKNNDEISLGSKIKLEIDENEPNYFETYSVGLTECWASLSEDPTVKTPSFELYTEKCPVAGIPWIKRVNEPGTTLVNPRGVSVIQFSFTASTPSDAFYYHCKIGICLNSDSTCVSDLTSTNCGNRKRRSSIISTKKISRRSAESGVSGGPAMVVTNDECLANGGTVTSSNGLNQCSAGKEQAEAKTSSAASGTCFLPILFWAAMN